MGPAPQGQIGQVGGAAIQPGAQMVGVAPGKGPGAGGEHTAPVAHGQGAGLGRLDDPAGLSDLQGLGGGATQGRGEQGQGRSKPCPEGGSPADPEGAGWQATCGSPGGRRPAGRRVPGPAVARRPSVASPTSRPRWSGSLAAHRRWVLAGMAVSGGVAADQHPGHRAVAGQPPTGLRGQRPGPADLPPSPPGRLRRLSRSTVAVSWGRTPLVWGSRPASRARRASSVRASAVRWRPLRGSAASAGRARGSRAASRVWPASASSSPSRATMPSQVGASHSPPPLMTSLGRRHQPGQPRRLTARRLRRMCVRVHGGNLPTRHRNTTTNPKNVDGHLRIGVARSSQHARLFGARRVPGGCRGPNIPDPPCRGSAWRQAPTHRASHMPQIPSIPGPVPGDGMGPEKSTHRASSPPRDPTTPIPGRAAAGSGGSRCWSSCRGPGRRRRPGSARRRSGWPGPCPAPPPTGRRS